VRYAQKVKKNPQRSILYRVDGDVHSPYPVQAIELNDKRLDIRTKFLLLLFALTFIIMITGVIFFGWWLEEMSAVFIGASIIFGIYLRLPESIFIEKFVTGAGSLLGVSLIIGVARGVTIVMNEGHISDSLLYYSSLFVGNMPPCPVYCDADDPIHCVYHLHCLHIRNGSCYYADLRSIGAYARHPGQRHC
jgi:uncharacterized ion transporter superfamily protein YfcC